MHPSQLLEFIFVGIAIVTIIFLSLFLKGKYSKVFRYLALIILIGYSVFFVARPYWIDYQINKKVELLKPYLLELYPSEEWKISTVPHRKDGFKHMNPYDIGVVFKNEPNTTYHYWVESKDNIYQNTYSTNKDLRELKHKEKR
ncbi:MAG: hypothetical protein K0S51_1167 [Bacillales bacterium]|jgi:hypothetical protein|nr:hypothetical protein [Bacillales bacterium]